MGVRYLSHQWPAANQERDGELHLEWHEIQLARLYKLVETKWIGNDGYLILIKDMAENLCTYTAPTIFIKEVEEHYVSLWGENNRKLYDNIPFVKISYDNYLILK